MKEILEILNMQNNLLIKKPELLSPCGDMERLNLALMYGADAVYLGSDYFTMRSAPKNFSPEQLKEAVSFAHAGSKKVYLTCNTFPHSEQLKDFDRFLAAAEESEVDALIVADMGLLSLIKKKAPDMEIHISTQAGIINYESARAFYNLGAKRIVLARELSLDEIALIRDKTDKKLEIECFVHGAMCMSFSGRCLMSNFMIGRDANNGLCAQPCRWEFEMTDKSRPGISYPIEFDNGGTYFMNSRDMCMIEHIPELVKAGIDSFKIEGRAKSAYYTAVVTNAYRGAIDGYFNCVDDNYKVEPWILNEMDKVSHRQYSTGFYFSHPNEEPNIDKNGGYIVNWDVVAFVEKCEDGIITLSQRNKFVIGDEIEFLEPAHEPVLYKVVNMYDDEMNEIESANHAMMTLKIKSDKVFKPGTLVRMKKKNQ